MASIIKVDELQEKTTGSGITLKAGLKNSSGTEIVSSTGSLTPTTITTTGDVSVGGNLTSTGNISPSGNFVVANGQGIDFSAVAGSAAGSTGALLDDYEEGTWTATITTDGTDFTTTGRDTSGYYTKVGNLVIAQCNPSINTPTNGTGNLIITGLPFFSSYTTISSSIRFGRFDLTSSLPYYVQVSAGGSYLTFYYNNNNANATAMTAAELNNNSTPYCIVVISYFAS